MSFDFKAATPVTSGVTSSYFLFGATSQVASTPSIFDVGAAVGSALATLTNKTFDTAGSGNSFSINGLAATANTGTGAVARETSPTLVTPVINSAAHVGGAWVADATWTLPAITLGGTVSGGGQQLNNIIIGTSTPLAGTFTTLTATTATITQGTITDPATMLSGTVTWNDASDVFTAWKLNVTNTNSDSTSMLVDLQVGSATKFNVDRRGVLNVLSDGQGITLAGSIGSRASGFINITAGSLDCFMAGNSGGTAYLLQQSSGAIGWWENGNFTGGAPDLTLWRDAANTLALRNSTNAQTFNLYSTYTSGANYERIAFYFGSSFYRLEPQAATGTVRGLILGGASDTYVDGTNINFRANGGTGWRFDSSNNLLAVSDNAYDIGASGATRPRTGYFGASLVSPILSRTAPVTETNSTHTLAATTTHLICNRAGDVTVTLPTASSFTGREIYIKTIQAQTVTSNASNVVPSTSATAGTAICPATDGAWAFLVSDGTSWVIMAANPLV